MNAAQKAVWTLCIVVMLAIILKFNVYTEALSPFGTKIGFAGSRGTNFLYLSGIALVIALITHHIVKK